MKKLLILLLTVCALLSVTACQDTNETPNEASGSATSNGGVELPEDVFD